MDKKSYVLFHEKRRRCCSKELPVLCANIEQFQEALDYMMYLVVEMLSRYGDEVPKSVVNQATRLHAQVKLPGFDSLAWFELLVYSRPLSCRVTQMTYKKGCNMASTQVYKVFFSGSAQSLHWLEVEVT